MYACHYPLYQLGRTQYECAWVQEEEERLRERLHEMAEYQSNDFSFKVAHDTLLSTSVNISSRVSAA